MADRKVILYIAASLDGYIAGPDDDLDFLGKVEQEGEDYGYGAFVETVDTVVLGRRTYDKVLSMGVDFPHADKACYVLTSEQLPAQGSVVFYREDPVALIQTLKQKIGKNIFIDGGAKVVDTLLKADVIDELVISIIPLLLGDGIRLFADGRPAADLQLFSAQSFPKGLVQLHYRRTR